MPITCRFFNQTQWPVSASFCRPSGISGRPLSGDLKICNSGNLWPIASPRAPPPPGPKATRRAPDRPPLRQFRSRHPTPMPPQIASLRSTLEDLRGGGPGRFSDRQFFGRFGRISGDVRYQVREHRNSGSNVRVRFGRFGAGSISITRWVHSAFPS